MLRVLTRFTGAFLCILCLPACASLGLSDRNRQFSLAHAEPLFGKQLDHCLDDPAVLLAALDQAYTKNAGSPSGSKVPPGCEQLVAQIKPAVVQSAMAGTYNVPAMNALDLVRRNELIDALIAVSNRKCSDYAAYLKTHDGQTNASLGILALLTGGVGSLVSDLGTSQALSGASAIFTGTRSALNETWFSNQTIHVLVSGFEKVRERELRQISNRKACPLAHYGIMAGIGDALRYHGACSLLAGLSEAAEAIERSDQPGLETLRRQLSDLEAIRAQAFNITDAPVFSSSPVEFELLASLNNAQQQADAARTQFKIASERYLALLEPTDSLAQRADIETLRSLYKAEVDRFQQLLQERETALATALAALNAERDRRSDAVAKANGARGVPKPLTGTKSAILICPYTGEASRTEQTSPQQTQPGNRSSR